MYVFTFRIMFTNAYNALAVFFVFIFCGSKSCKISFLYLSRQFVKSKFYRYALAFLLGQTGLLEYKKLSILQTLISPQKRKRGSLTTKKEMSIYSPPLCLQRRRGWGWGCKTRISSKILAGFVCLVWFYLIKMLY